jgi:predicted ATPase
LRFLEEARAASALNHPNIVTVYDVGAANGRPYIVMEWIDGRTLRQRLGEGPFAMPEVFGVASQIADALAAAHEKGVVHRDLKPENIMICPDGRAKVLDFGIAKRSVPQDAATLDIGFLTLPGSIMGTPGYMSPEQARGEPLDFRTDQFSFGALLYEMTTGRRAFAGKSTAEVQAAILFHQPEPLTRVNPHTPAPLQWIVDRCLAKTAQDRFSSTSELRKELSDVVANTSSRAAAAPPVDNMPTPRTPLVGRELELSRLEQLIADPGVRLLTLTGAGGIGKTRLALELCRRIIVNFSGGICFVPLDKVSQADLVPTEVMRALGVTQSFGQSAESAIANHLIQHAAGPMLLLLDNCEQILDAAIFVGRLASERLKIVVTSRAPLRVYGEYEFPVPSLSVGDASEAVRLFLDRAPGLRGTVRDPEQLRIVSEICLRLDGLPLAIELAAARTKLLSLKALRDRLSDPLALLVGGARDLPQRQHTLRATLDWSYNLLDAEHQKLFRRMAVFVGGATIEEIEAVCDTRQDLQVNLWEAMELLAGNSLIRRLGADDEEPRFAMLETMREYGLERLAAASEDAYVRKAHAAYFLVLAEEESPKMRRERTGRHRFDAELGNFRAAIDWLTQTGGVEWGLRLTMALGVYFFSIRLHPEGRDRLLRLLALPGVEHQPRLRNWGRYYASDFASDDFASEMNVAFADQQSLWDAFEQANDEQGMLHLAHRLGFNYKFEDLQEARRWSERAVEIARRSFTPAVVAGSLSNLADVERIGGQFAFSRSLYLEASRLFEESGEIENAVWSLCHQADLYREEGNEEQARRLYQVALTRFRALNLAHGVASCLHDLAALDAAEGKLDLAEPMYQESLRLYGTENKIDMPRVLESLAGLELKKSQPERALVISGAAAAIRERFRLRIRNPAQRAAVEACTTAARTEAGRDGASHWMKGWNMTPDQIMAFAGGNKEDPWKTL